jgi:cytosine/adenosine deaminase-related metal-dependent hydrolase
MLFKNLHIVGQDKPLDVRVQGGKIKATGNLEAAGKEPVIEIENAIAFPGLINSHDHLDFNCFSQTGNRIYENYTEWSYDIKKHNGKELDCVLKIPVRLRTKLGMYKNLLAGVTTVVNHGEHLNIQDNLISVFQDCYSLHSIHFENNWKYQLNRLFNRRESYVIHVGEGTDKASGEEIDTLTKWNLFKRKLVGIHGVSMNEEQASKFHAMVWCPVSNYFLLGATSNIDKLKKYTHVLFGTDSTLTADWNIWEHLRKARDTGMLTDEELYKSVTSTAAMVWNLNKGEIVAGKDADFILARNDSGGYSYNDFFKIDPEDILMIVHRGHVRLIDEKIFDVLLKIGFNSNDLNKIIVNGHKKIISGDVFALAKEARSYCPSLPKLFQTA